MIRDTWYSALPKHPDYPRGTSASFVGDNAGFVVAPSDQNRHTALFMSVVDGSGRIFEKDGCLFMQSDLALDELDELIANLQRARSGCFFNKYPREQHDTTRLVRDRWKVGDLLSILAEHPDDAVVTFVPNATI